MLLVEYDRYRWRLLSCSRLRLQCLVSLFETACVTQAQISFTVTVVLGAQWGDEGKGKLVDILAAEVDICARCAGGNNAGHTIVATVGPNNVKTTFDFHLLPSGLYIGLFRAEVATDHIIFIRACQPRLYRINRSRCRCACAVVFCRAQ